MFEIGAQKLLILLVIVMIIFGAGKLPQIGESLGKAVKGFKKAVDDSEDVKNITSKNDKKTMMNSDIHDDKWFSYLKGL